MLAQVCCLLLWHFLIMYVLQDNVRLPTLPREMCKTLQQCLCGAMQFERSLGHAKEAASLGHLFDQQHGETFSGDLNTAVEYWNDPLQKWGRECYVDSWTRGDVLTNLISAIWSAVYTQGTATNNVLWSAQSASQCHRWQNFSFLEKLQTAGRVIKTQSSIFAFVSVVLPSP